ncbi:hypothetical protein [Tenacibaculum sp.]|uniref:hypothetical protein n=1 Tax=Tenacibaculum sp. TaxID=1906242 RepID=UPI003AA8CA69
MRYLQIMCFSVLLACMSCNEETENIHLSNTVENDIVNIIASKNTSGIVTNIPIVLQPQEVHNMMYMTSFLIGRTLIENEDAREYFYRLYTGKSLKVSLRTLLENNRNAFEIAFKQQYGNYNRGTDPEGEPTHPISSPEPDPLERGYDVLNDYSLYYYYIHNSYDWEVYIPNKLILYNYSSFTNYLNDKDRIINLWSLSTNLYDDGVSLTSSNGVFIPSNFNYLQELTTSLILTLRNSKG